MHWPVSHIDSSFHAVETGLYFQRKLKSEPSWQKIGPQLLDVDIVRRELPRTRPGKTQTDRLYVKRLDTDRHVKCVDLPFNCGEDSGPTTTSI